MCSPPSDYLVQFPFLHVRPSQYSYDFNDFDESNENNDDEDTAEEDNGFYGGSENEGDEGDFSNGIVPNKSGLYLPNNIDPYDHCYFPGGEFDTHSDMYEPETVQPVPFAHDDGQINGM